MPPFGNILRSARLRAGLTIRDVARQIDASESQIQKWESGSIEPRARVLFRYIEGGLMSADESYGLKAIDVEEPAA